MKQGAMRTYIVAGGVAIILAGGAVGYGLFVKNTADRIEQATQDVKDTTSRIFMFQAFSV